MNIKDSSWADFEEVNVFGLGEENTGFSQYFLGKSFLKITERIADATKVDLFKMEHKVSYTADYIF